MLNLSAYNIILASRSPRRQMLLKGLDIDFEIRLKDTPEDYPLGMEGKEVALMLSRRKSHAFGPGDLPENFLLITADTIVWMDGKILNKPESNEEAMAMLQTLSGRRHTVYTGVCLRSESKEEAFCATTDVYFRNLNRDEIKYYVDRYKPYDKAGAYGAQEWIGYVAIERIEGSYFNVMGLPVQMLYASLQRFAPVE
jgi:septum formation protein